MKKDNYKNKSVEEFISSNSKMSLFFIALAIFGFLIVLLPVISSSYSFKELGPLGDTVGGILNPLIGIAAALLTFLAFYIQYQANQQVRRQFKIQQFESQFFEMIRLYRSNVNELRFVKLRESGNQVKNDFVSYENRQVIRILFREFIYCFREVKNYSISKSLDELYNPNFLRKIKPIIEKRNPEICLKELAIIDIAYCIFFYGLGITGDQVLSNLFVRKYNNQYYTRLLFYIKLKPKISYKDRFQMWKTLRKKNVVELHEIVNELFENRNLEDRSNLSDFAKGFKTDKEYDKYYSGHQFRLGHYFRHLFQSYKYIESRSDLSQEEKYKYGKLYRAQLSNFEQALLFINSISSMGRKWEIIPEQIDIPNYRSNLITTYNLIKNLPGEYMYDIHYKHYYPEVNYESDEQLI